MDEKQRHEAGMKIRCEGCDAGASINVASKA